MINDIRDEHDEEYIDELHKERGEMKEARKKQIKAQMDNERYIAEKIMSGDRDGYDGADGARTLKIR